MNRYIFLDPESGLGIKKVSPIKNVGTPHCGRTIAIVGGLATGAAARWSFSQS